MTKARTQPHFRTHAGKRALGRQIYRGVYSGAPTPFLLMTPEFEIIDANEAYLAATMRQRDSLAGLNMFEAFPDNPDLAEANGVANLKQSLFKARSDASRDVMAVQRYDVTDPEGNWQVRYWRPVNWPVLDEKGSILALVHHVTNATADTLAQQKLQSMDVLFRRAEAVCEESRRLREETLGRINRMARGLPRR